ncbi:MAG: hypothetical protein AAF289_04790 [Cyanobacteria bacterium P01_A01_bin.135]
MAKKPQPEREDASLALYAQIETTGTISRQDYFRLITLLLANQVTVPGEVVQINAIFDHVRLGHLQVVD